MKNLLTKEITGYKISIIITDNNKLAVKLENDKGEFVGQLFSSIDGFSDLFTRLSSGEKLTEKEVTDIKKKYDAHIAKATGESVLEKLLKSSSPVTEAIINGKGKLLSDITIGTTVLTKDTVVTYKIDNDKLFINNLPTSIQLSNSLKITDLVK